MEEHGYHHGDLRRALLAAAVDEINANGPAALSLRELARRTGVSHAAPKHHFGDKAGLLTALAAEGFRLLHRELAAAGGDLLEVGVAYVRFAVEHPAHFQVMFQPTLYRAGDPDIVEARSLTRRDLQAGLRALPANQGARPHAGIAAWSIVHGFATLWLGRAVPAEMGDDPVVAARAVIAQLFDRPA